MDRIKDQDESQSRRQNPNPGLRPHVASKIFIAKQMVDLTETANANEEKPHQDSKIANRIRNFFLKQKSADIQEAQLQRHLSKNLTFEDDEVFRELDDLYEVKNRPKTNKKNQGADLDSFEISEERVNPTFDRKIRNLNIQRVKNEDNCYLRIIEMNNFEALKVYTDRFPLLKARKMLMVFLYAIQAICLKIVKNPIFEFLSISLIILNSVFLMMDDPSTKSDTSIADQSDMLFTIFYTIESGLKILAYGFVFGKTPFIRDIWNVLDLVIIGSSWLTYFLSNINVNLNALRSLRVLRPLKTIASIKKLKMLILTIFSAVPYLIDILFILLFVYLIFAIGGLNLFNGVLQNRCINDLTNEINEVQMYCSEGSSCSEGFTCKGGYPNPNWGVTNFDNIGSAMLMVFQVTTLEGWYDILADLKMAFSGFFEGIVIGYFIILIFIGNFFILNLTLAVIIVKFNESRLNKNDIKVAVKHGRHCICDEGVAYNKMKICGYFENMWQVSKRDSVLTHTLKDIHTMNMRTKKKREAKSEPKKIKIGQTAKSLADLDAKGRSFSDGEESVIFHKVNSKVSKTMHDIPLVKGVDDELIILKNDEFGNKDLKVPKLKIPEIPVRKSKLKPYDEEDPIGVNTRKKSARHIGMANNRANSIEVNVDMLNMVESYNRVLEVSPNMLARFDPISLQIDEEPEVSFDKNSDEQSLRIKNSVKTGDSEERFKKDLMRAILKEGDDESNESKEWDETINNIDKRKPIIYSIRNKKSVSTFNKQKNFDDSAVGGNRVSRRTRLLTDHEGAIKKALETKIKYLKLDLNSCKKYEPMDLFDSRNDIFSSKTIDAENKAAADKLEKLKTTKLDFFYDRNRILFELYSEIQRKANKAPMKFSKLKFNSGTTFVPTMNSMISLETPNRSRNNVVDKMFMNHDYYNITNQYYPIAEPLYKVIPDNAVRSISRSNNHDSKRKNSKHTKSIQQSKLLKQTVKNFQSVKEYFEEEFKPIPDRTDLYEIEKKALDCYYQSIIDQDLRHGRIDRYNWSGFDVISINNFTLPKFDSIIHSLNNEIQEMWIPGFFGKITVMRRYIRYFLVTSLVENFLFFLVFLNTTILALDGLLSTAWNPTLNILNTIFTILFTIELSFKLFALGPIKYVKDAFNIFDAVIVGFSLFELSIGTGSNIISAIRVVRVFRAIRVLRVTRLLRTLRFMKVIIEVIMSSLEQFIYIALLLMLFIIIFSLIGMQLFAGKFTFYEPGEVKRQNFDSFVSSFLSVFQIVTMENWNDILYLSMRSSQYSVVSIVYLITWIFVGNYIFLNLFLAILLDGFTSYSTLKAFREIENEETKLQSIFKQQKEFMDSKKAKLEHKSRLLKQMEEDDYEEIHERYDEVHRKQTTIRTNQLIVDDTSVVHTSKIRKMSSDDDEQSSLNSTNSDNNIEKYLASKKSSHKKIDLYQDVIEENALFIFNKNNCIRRYVSKIVIHPYFDFTIITMIILSSLKLVIETYETDSWEGTKWRRFLDVSDILLNVIFLLECLFKVITYGFVISEGSYLRDSWCSLDFFIVVTSTLDMILASANLGFLKILRLLRTLRPLRFLSHYENLRIVVSCLIESIGGIINVFIVILMIWIMFGILGINLLKGRMNYCLKEGLDSYYGINKTNCLAMGGEWAIWDWNFDNILNGIVTLFVLSSLESWPNIMFTFMDGDSEDKGPSLHANFNIYIFFVIFILIGSLFLMNLFVGVIFFQFTSEQDKERKKKFRFVTDDQMKWILMQRLIVNAQPNIQLLTPPKNPIRLLLFKISQSKVFEVGIIICILLNMVTMAIIYHGMSTTYSNILDQINLAFTIIFVMEAVIKLIAQGLITYLRVGWNRFDFGIAIISIADLFMNSFLDIKSFKIYPQLVRILKILRLSRLLKILKSKTFDGFNKIIKTLVFAFPALFNVLSLLFLIYFIYAVLGVFIYKDVEGVFMNFGATLLELFRYSTGENWPSAMYDFSAHNAIVGRLYFISFTFLSSFIMINMFVLIVIEQFENFYFNPNNPITSFGDISDEFRKTWSFFTLEQNGLKIKNNDLFNFFICLKAPLGFYIQDENKSSSSRNYENFNVNYFLKKLSFDHNYIRRKIANMNLYVDDKGYVSFGQVLHAAMKNAFGKKLGRMSSNANDMVREIEKRTVALLLKRNMSLKRIGSNSRKDLKLKVANPFTNLLFLRLTYQSWYNYTKKHISRRDRPKEDFADYSDIGSDFEEKVLNQIKRPEILDN